MIDFTFEEETHTYQTATGRAPSCTDILALGGFVDFRFVNEDHLERKSEIGREVHKACHLYNTGKPFTCDDQIRGYLGSWEEWCLRTKFKVWLSEHQQIGIVNAMQYGMQLDVAGDLQGEETVIDYKTGVIMPHHGIQLAGYAGGLYHPRFESSLARFRVRKRIVVQLQKDGSLAKIRRFEDKSDFDAFTAALFTTYWKMKHGKFYKEMMT
jgi:hypothetical protein